MLIPLLPNALSTVISRIYPIISIFNFTDSSTWPKENSSISSLLDKLVAFSPLLFLSMNAPQYDSVKDRTLRLFTCERVRMTLVNCSNSASFCSSSCRHHMSDSLSV